MTIGFLVNYCKSDDMLITFQLASQLERLGISVSFFTVSEFQKVDDYWDTRVTKKLANDFTKWVESVSTVVCNDFPSVDLVNYIRELNRKIYVIFLWSSFSETNVPTVEYVDKIICPAKCVYQLAKDKLSKYRNKLVCIPWTITNPTIRNEKILDSSRTSFYWNMDGTQTTKQSDRCVSLLDRLNRLQNVYVTITYNSLLCDSALNDIRRITNTSDGRIELFKNLSFDQQILTAAKHDFVLWPSVQDDAGFPGLLATVAGTPCIAFDHPVIGEVVRNRNNGLLVPCNLKFNWFDVPTVDFEPNIFFDHVVELLNYPSMLEKFRKTIQLGFEKRNLDFECSISDLFAENLFS